MLISDALEWCISQEEVAYVFHYLDDFAVLGPPESIEHGEALHTFKKIAAELDIPLAEDDKMGLPQR